MDAKSRGKAPPNDFKGGSEETKDFLQGLACEKSRSEVRALRGSVSPGSRAGDKPPLLHTTQSHFSL